MAREKTPAISDQTNFDSVNSEAVRPGHPSGTPVHGGAPGASAQPAQSGDTPDATTPPTTPPVEGGGQSPIDQSTVLCPSGNPDDPFGPTPDAPFGFKKDGTPKKSSAGRPPARSPRDPAADADDAAKSAAPDTARLTNVRKAGPRKAPAVVPKTGTVTVDYEAMGQGVAALWFNCGVIVFGSDWEPNIEQREHVAVSHAFRDYFRSKEMADLPPGVNLSLVLLTYSLSRINKPTVQSRLGGIVGGFKRGMAWLRGKMTFGRSRTLANT